MRRLWFPCLHTNPRVTCKLSGRHVSLFFLGMQCSIFRLHAFSRLYKTWKKNMENVNYKSSVGQQPATKYLILIFLTRELTRTHWSQKIPKIILVELDPVSWIQKIISSVSEHIVKTEKNEKLKTPLHTVPCNFIDRLIDWPQKQLKESLGLSRLADLVWNGVFQTQFWIVDRMALIEIFFDSEEQSFRRLTWTAESHTYTRPELPGCVTLLLKVKKHFC